MLFISWPKRLWAEREFQSKEFPADLEPFLRQAQREHGVVSQLAHRNDIPDNEQHQLLLMPENVVVRGVKREDISRALAALLEGASLPSGYDVYALEAPTLFICTHGQRDRCCAKFGYALYEALENERVRRGLPLQLWESTHLGGDRFAANAFAFPWAHMYGHLRREHATPLLEHVLSGRVYVPVYRGSMRYAGVRQLAEAFGQWQCEERGLTPKIVIGAAREHSDTRAEVSLALGEEPPLSLLLHCVRREYEVTIDCEQLDAQRKRVVRRWTVESTEPSS